MEWRWVIANAVNEIRQENQLLPSQGLPRFRSGGRSLSDHRILRQNRVPEIEKQISGSIDAADRRDDKCSETWVNLIREDASASSESYANNIYVPMGGGYIPLHVYHSVERQVGPASMPPSAIGAYMDYVTSQYFYSFWHLMLWPSC